jgi:hypothetical protein
MITSPLLPNSETLRTARARTKHVATVSIAAAAATGV